MNTFGKVTFLALLAIVLATTGCATIVTGRTQTISINSTPAGAIAHVGDQKVVTPGTVTLDRNKDYTVRLEKDGYQAATAQIKKGVNPWILGNILIGGIPGIIIDLITGSAAQLNPDTINLTLSPLTRSDMLGTKGEDLLSEATDGRRQRQVPWP